MELVHHPEFIPALTIENDIHEPDSRHFVVKLLTSLSAEPPLPSSATTFQ